MVDDSDDERGRGRDTDSDTDSDDDGQLRGVPGTGLVGLYGRPFLRLDPLLGINERVFAGLHEEMCLALAQVPVDYTGGSHRSMGIMPASQRDSAVVDYGEVLRSLSNEQWGLFVSLADDPTDYDGVSRNDVGEERQAPLSRRQMLWLKVRHGVFFPWKAYVEMMPNRRWSDKANPEGKRFTRHARQFFPRTLELVEQLPFEAIGRCNLMGLEANDWGTVHRDGEPEHQDRADEFITLYPVKNKRLFLWDEDQQQRHFVDDASAVWFNDFDYHGVEAAPFFRYSLRVDGVFTDAFRALLLETFS